MPRTEPATQKAAPAGAVVALSTPDALGDIVEVGSGVVLLVRNGSAGSVTVTAQTPATVEGVAVAEVALVLAAGATGAIALTPRLFRRTPGSADAGKAYIDYSAVAGVERVVIACQ